MHGTFQYVPLLGQPCEAKRTGHTWGQTCAPGLDDQPHCGIPLEQPFCVQLAKPAERRSPLIPWIWLFLYRIPWLSKRWFHSHSNWLTSGGSIFLDCYLPKVPSQSLEMTKHRVGSACWAWCQSSKVIQATCQLSWTASRMCKLQL